MPRVRMRLRNREVEGSNLRPQRMWLGIMLSETWSEPIIDLQTHVRNAFHSRPAGKCCDAGLSDGAYFMLCDPSSALPCCSPRHCAACKANTSRARPDVPSCYAECSGPSASSLGPPFCLNSKTLLRTANQLESS